MLPRAPCLGTAAAGNSRTLLRIIHTPNTPATAVSAAAEEAKVAATASQPPFQNVQRFYVPDVVKPHFEAAWKAREAYMETQPGFVSFNVASTDETYTITSKWASIPEWEAFNLSKEARRHHLPWGIWQYVPKEGEGFPEDFVPFLDMNVGVTARYPKKKK